MSRHRTMFAGVGVLCLTLLPLNLRGAETAKAKETPKKLDAQALAARIDQHVAASWTKNKVVPAKNADDAEFVRRAYLDLIGRIPSVSEVRKFLADKSTNKRETLVEELLKTAGFSSNLAGVWRDMMIPQNNNPNLQALGPQLEAWLSGHFSNKTPYDEMVRELITAPVFRQGVQPRPVQGQPGVQGSTAAFYQFNENKPENIAAATSRLFLGVRLECAQCHDHPFNQYSREQFWEYAAFFAGITPQGQGQGRVQPGREDPTIREIKIPGLEKVVKAKFLDGKQPKWGEQINARQTLAEWMTAAENPYFARAAVNKLWWHFMGMGIIDPVDEPGDANPPSHPELLDELAQQFVLNGYDMRYLVKAIATSKVYQLSSMQSDPSQEDPRLLGRMNVKGLTFEQLYDSLIMATGYKDPYAAQRRYGFARFDPMAIEFRAKFSNSADRRTEYQTSILQALSMMNGKFIADATSLSGSETLLGVIDSPFMDVEGKLDALYLAALGRKMRPEEGSRMVRYVTKGGPSGDQKKALADVFWALLNTSEFILNH